MSYKYAGESLNLKLEQRFFIAEDSRKRSINPDRGVPHGTTPPTPPGIRVRTTAVQKS